MTEPREQRPPAAPRDAAESSRPLPSPGSLWMVRLDLDAARIAREGIALPPRQEDLGFLVHRSLAGLFGEGAVQPFRVLDDNAREVPVLGYTRTEERELREYAATFAEPAHYAACAWDRFASKPMPDLAPGRRLGFELRACPVVRLGGEREVSGKNGKPLRYPAHSELDWWEHRRFFGEGDATAGAELDRRTAYADWLRARLCGAADLGTVRLVGFRRIRLVRRDHGSPRKARTLERPDALLRGDLVVRNGDAFRRLLTRGVGRHCAFGFGMLLLRPPGSC
jgi:CRISPR system Cascade subunit CasE